MSFAATLRIQGSVSQAVVARTPVTPVQPMLAALRNCPVFSSWSQGSLAQLAMVCSLRSFGPGQVVVAEGKRLDHAFAVIRGRLRAVRRADRGREVTLEVFRSGSVCVEALLDTTSVMVNDLVASETTLVMFIPREAMLTQLRQNPDAALLMVADMERRLQGAKAMASGLALADVEERLRDVLVRLAHSEGEPTPAGTLIRKSPTQQELGTMIGACRETVSRIVADLARKGLLTLRGRKLTLAPELVGLSFDEPRAAVGSA